MKPNRMKSDLRAGRTIHGTICTQGTADSAELAARAGFDFVLMDWQHGGFNRESVREAARAVQTTDATPMARTSATSDPGQIEYLLDSGYPALTFPMVNTVEHARRLVDAAYYPPRGHRSIGNCRATLAFGDDYYVHANDELLLVPYLENVEAVENAAAIMATDGIDGCIIGTSDLTASLGLPLTKLGGTDNPDLDRAIERIYDATVNAGKIPGIYVNTPEQAKRRADQGFHCIVVGYEFGLLTAAMRGLVGKLKSRGH